MQRSRAGTEKRPPPSTSERDCTSKNGDSWTAEWDSMRAVKSRESRQLGHVLWSRVPESRELVCVKRMLPGHANSRPACEF